MKKTSVKENSASKTLAWFEGKQSKPLQKFVPSKGAIKFWETLFPKLDEIGVLDYLEGIVPILEHEIGRKFNWNQLMNLLDTVDFEGRHIVNKYESMFFIDRIWNNLDIQARIWNEKYKSMDDIVAEFLEKRNNMRDSQHQSNGGKKADLLPDDMFKPFTLKDYLPVHSLEKVPHNRHLEFRMRVIRPHAGSHEVKFANIHNEVRHGSVIDVVGKEVMFDGSIIRQKSRSAYSDMIPNYARMLLGEEKTCDLYFSEDDVKMGSFHFSLEKFGNTLFAHDTSKYSRLKFRVKDKPYVLDEGMVWLA